jgi:hypothetical protein
VQGTCDLLVHKKSERKLWTHENSENMNTGIRRKIHLAHRWAQDRSKKKTREKMCEPSRLQTKMKCSHELYIVFKRLTVMNLWYLQLFSFQYGGLGRVINLPFKIIPRGNSSIFSIKNDLLLKSYKHYIRHLHYVDAHIRPTKRSSARKTKNRRTILVTTRCCTDS